MMTVVMDRTLTAPAPPDARSPGVPASDGRTSRAPVPFGGPVRRLVAGIAVGAAAMLGVAVLDSVADTTVPVLGSFAALPERAGGPAFVEVPPPPATPGTCLNWTRGDAADAAVVECAQPHLFEQAGSVSLADQTVLPDERGFRQLVEERCTPVVLTYLGGRFDPDGRFRVGALKPSAAKWAEGDRELRCGLQSSSRSGAMFTTTGNVAGSDQAAVQEPGTCLGIDGRTIGDPVSCAQPHAVETVGVVDLGPKFPDAFPKVEDQDAFLQPECARIAGEYAGDPNAIEAKKLTVYWDNLGEDSWKVGTRRVNCNLAALLPDRSGFAPVTGSVRDANTVVSDQPAPPAPESTDPAPVVPTDPPQDGAPEGEPAPTAPPSSAPPSEAPPTETGAPNPADPPVPFPGGENIPTLPAPGAPSTGET
ncbi:MAG: septum formation family protein [Pseudonocardia sp.]